MSSSINKGLMVIYDPHALMQFVEFYCMNEYDVEWDALCLPLEGGKEQMMKHCVDSQIFRNVYTGDKEYRSVSVIEKGLIFAKALWYAVTVRKKKFCIDELRRYGIDANKYDIFAANTDTGFISGMLALFAPDKEVVYFEDGMGEYGAPRKRWKSCLRNQFENIQAVAMARLGYFGKGFTWHDETKNTIKYCTNKREIMYKNFREIRELKLGNLEKIAYSQIMGQVYPELKNIHIDNRAAIIFTIPDEMKHDKWSDYLNLFFEKVHENFDRIIIKPHPRDNIDYLKLFSEYSERITVLDRRIPAELFTHLINETNTCFFMIAETVMLSLYQTGCRVVLLLWKEVVGEDNVEVQYTDLERFLPGRYIVEEINL